MDPVPITRVVAGLISLAIEVTKISDEFYSSAKGTPRSIKGLLQELTGLTHVRFGGLSWKLLSDLRI